VAVDLDRDALVRVADPVIEDLGVHPAVEGERRTGVPDVVQPRIHRTPPGPPVG
jgi:hypothetical protein